jgi:hypothetical protein
MAHGQQITVARKRAEQAPPPRAAEPAPASVHRMVILQGPNRSVHYITSANLSSGDRLAAYDLERAENALTYHGDLQSLKQQYVNSERILEPQRLYVQEQLYGTQIRYGGSSVGYYGGGGGYGGLGYAGYYPYYGFGGYGYPGAIVGSLGSSSYSVTRSLQYGMGDEGRFKNAMVQVIARDASLGHTAAMRDYDAAMGRASASPILSRDLALPKSTAPAAPQEPSFKKGSKVTIWLGKDKYAGTVRDDRPGWVVLQTDKAEVTVRKSEITRSEASAKE